MAIMSITPILENCHTRQLSFHRLVIRLGASLFEINDALFYLPQNAP